MGRLTILAAVFAVLPALPVHAGEKKAKKPKRPEIRLRVSPPIQNEMYGFLPHVTLFITITNVTAEWEQYWSPGIRVEWGDGGASGREGDSLPFDQAPAGDLARKTYTFEHDYRATGHLNIRVMLTRAGKTFDTENAVVIINGI